MPDSATPPTNLADYPRLVVKGLTPTQCAILSRSRKFSLYKKNRADLLAGKCPFCPPDPAVNVICYENDCWWAWRSKWPEDNAALHLMIVPKRHVHSMRELDDATEGLALLQALRSLDEMLGITFSGLLCRDGDATLSAGTIEHLHWHKMVPDGRGRLETPMAKGHPDEQKGHARAIIFEKLRQQIDEMGANPDLVIKALSEEEFSLVTGRLE